MPLYEFKCKRCEHKFTLLVSSSAAISNTVICPECRSSEVERIFSPFASLSGSSNKSSGGCADGSCGWGCKE